MVMLMSWSPREATIDLLDRAMAHVESVPYKVSIRWLFYALLQDGTFSRKQDYFALKGVLSKARKAFYGGWAPDTLVDDTRQAAYSGQGWTKPSDWLGEYIAAQECLLDAWRGQDNYVEICFEAKAMMAQFQYYTRNVILRPFGGDYSIAAKWEMAKEIESRWERLDRPNVVILYFGDLDPKGMQIPESAECDIREWCHAPFQWIRCGLNPGDEDRYNLPENIDRPGAYQWEAGVTAGPASSMSFFIHWPDSHAVPSLKISESLIASSSRWLRALQVRASCLSDRAKGPPVNAGQARFLFHNQLLRRINPIVSMKDASGGHPELDLMGPIGCGESGVISGKAGNEMEPDRLAGPFAYGRLMQFYPLTHRRP